VIGPSFNPNYFEIAVWQCPRCQRILEHRISAYMSYTMGEGSMWCPCYALLPAQGCVELRTITKMEPLNEAAVRHEESIRKMKKYWEEKEIAEREARERAQAYNDSWGWSTCA
jgi:hypothetical protein